MNGLEILIGFGGVALGFLIGMITELITENRINYELREENRRLSNALAKERAKKKTEVIEIYDKWSVNSSEPDEITFPNKTGF